MKPLNTTDPEERLSVTLGDIFDYGRVGYIRGCVEVTASSMNTLTTVLLETYNTRPAENLYNALVAMQAAAKALADVAEHTHAEFVAIGLRLRPAEAVNQIRSTQPPAQG